jgi:hypothetical protein
MPMALRTRLESRVERPCRAVHRAPHPGGATACAVDPPVYAVEVEVDDFLDAGQVEGAR